MRQYWHVYSLVKWAIAWFCTTWILLECLDALKAFAGEETDIDVSVFMKFVTEFGIYVPLALLALLMLLSLSSLRFMYRRARDREGRIRILERYIDPDIDQTDEHDQSSTDDTNQEEET